MQVDLKLVVVIGDGGGCGGVWDANSVLHLT